MADGFVRVPDPLVEAVRAVSHLPENASLASLARWSMATAADWPPEAVALVARVRGGNRAEAEGQAG